MALLVADRIDRPPVLFGDELEGHGALGGGRTLDDAIVGAWEGLLARASVACVLCGEPLRPRHGSPAGTVSGRCEGCGTTLA
ncbi:MAG: hypothetical protein WBC33_08705 [Conexibacter sp.]